MADNMRILLFGDQTTDPRENRCDQLLAGRSTVLFTHFIQKVGVALKNDIAQLCFSQQDEILRFSTVEELADRSL